jgi:hypothetical protein
VALASVFWMTRDTCVEPCVTTDDRILALRIGGLLLAIGAAFLFDDPTEETTLHLPVARWLRRGVRICLVAPPMAVFWTLLVAVALRGSIDRTPFPRGALGLELTGMIVAAMAVSVTAAQFVPERMGGVAAGPITIALFVTAYLLPGRLTLFPSSPLHAYWAHAHTLWRLVLAAAVTVLAIGCRDPFRRLLPARGQLARRDT